MDFVMAAWPDLLIRKLREHSTLSNSDIVALRRLPYTRRRLVRDDDVVRQGDRPKASAIVQQGMVARYHTFPSGGRQYISLHIAGDMPDAQSLFLETMDHSVCAMEDAQVILVPHDAILALFEERSTIGLAIWRETLVDAAIFRQAIINNSGRRLQTRLAHFFCEQYYRARAIGEATTGSCSLPLTQTQIGETVGASLPSVSRALHVLRQTKSMDLQGGRLHIRNWARMVRLGQFDPGYLQLRRPLTL
jgi:CRP-like cAMP-binding protein